LRAQAAAAEALAREIEQQEAQKRAQEQLLLKQKRDEKRKIAGFASATVRLSFSLLAAPGSRLTVCLRQPEMAAVSMSPALLALAAAAQLGEVTVAAPSTTHVGGGTPAAPGTSPTRLGVQPTFVLASATAPLPGPASTATAGVPAAAGVLPYPVLRSVSIDSPHGGAPISPNALARCPPTGIPGFMFCRCFGGVFCCLFPFTVVSRPPAG
jgi:hypothetical protein